MRWIIAGLAALVLVGCDNGSNAPFGLTWNQSIGNISFIKAGDCSQDGSNTTCKFNNQKPFNNWSYENALSFDAGKLTGIQTTFVGMENREFFCSQLKLEFTYLVSLGANQSALAEVEKNCAGFNATVTNGISELFPLTHGVAKIYLTSSPFVGVITYENPS